MGVGSKQLASVGGGYYKQIDENHYEFFKIHADARAYFNLFYRRVFMLHGTVRGKPSVRN